MGVDVVNSQLTVSQECAQVAKKVNGMYMVNDRWPVSRIVSAGLGK